MNNFIEIYDNTLLAIECVQLINEFENSPKIKGSVLKEGNPVVDTELKDSIELNRCSFQTPSLISSIINPPLLRCLSQYKEKYSAFTYLSAIDIYSIYTFQKFEGTQAGYKKWHTEHIPGEDAPKRVLVWAFYLNDAEGTEFMYYPSVSARQGRCVIFPASFNYMHRSVPNKGTKYITTGWISYE